MLTSMTLRLTHVLRTVNYLAVTLFFLFFACSSLSEPNQHSAGENAEAPPPHFDALPEIADVDILAINSEIKGWLDKHVAPISRRTLRAQLLHEYLFSPEHRNIQYRARPTKTAQETFDSGSGNCLSLASLYVASARYVGLNARFQTVSIPVEWEDEENFYVIPGHVNAVINLPRDRVTIEFANIYSAWRTQEMTSKIISDSQAKAEYFNNIGMEYLEDNNLPYAIANLKKSIGTYAKLDFAWSNLGVAYKLTGQLDEAETSYKKALRISKTNLSTINNLYILYVQTGKEKEAEKLTRKVEKYSQRNPYYLYKLAQSDMALKNYDAVITLLKRAIRKKPSEPKFHLLLGQTYYYLGNLQESVDALNKAVELANGSEEEERYQTKLKALERMRAQL